MYIKDKKEQNKYNKEEYIMKDKVKDTGNIDVDNLLHINKKNKRKHKKVKTFNPPQTDYVDDGHYYMNTAFFYMLYDFGFKEDYFQGKEVFIYNCKDYPTGPLKNSSLIIQEEDGRIIFDYVKSEDIESILDLMITFIAIGAMTFKEND